MSEPSAAQAPSSESEIAIQRADMLLEVGRPEQARAMLLPLLGGDADETVVHAGLARCALELGEHAQTVHWAKEGLVKAPDDVPLLVWLAAGLVYGDVPDEGLPVTERIVQLAPDAWAGHCLRGLALDALGRRREARAAMDTVLELDPENETARVWRGGRTLEGMGTKVPFLGGVRAHQARGQAKDLLRDDPESVPALVLAAGGALNSPDQREAGRLLSQAAALAPDTLEVTGMFRRIMRAYLRRSAGVFGLLCFVFGAVNLDKPFDISLFNRLIATAAPLFICVPIVTLAVGASAAGRTQMRDCALRPPLVIVTALTMLSAVLGAVTVWWPLPALPLVVVGALTLVCWLVLVVGDRRAAKRDGVKRRRKRGIRRAA